MPIERNVFIVICHAVICVVACSAMIGCNGGGTESTVIGAVGVIDLDAVALRLGIDKTIADSIRQRQTSLNEQLAGMAKSIETQLAERKSASEQNVDDQVTLAAWHQQAQTALDKARRQVEANLVQHRTDLIRQFREQIKPAARRVARARGLSLIVTKNETVVYDFVDAVDITDAVASQLVAQRSAANGGEATAPTAQ